MARDDIGAESIPHILWKWDIPGKLLCP